MRATRCPDCGLIQDVTLMAMCDPDELLTLEDDEPAEWCCQGCGHVAAAEVGWSVFLMPDDWVAPLAKDEKQGRLWE